MKIGYWNREETGGISLLLDSNCWKICNPRQKSEQWYCACRMTDQALNLECELKSHSCGMHGSFRDVLWSPIRRATLQPSLSLTRTSHPRPVHRPSQPRQNHVEETRDKWTCGRADSLPSLSHIFRKSVKLSFFKKGSCLLYRFSPTWTNSGQSISAREATAWFHPRSEALLGRPRQPLMRASPTSNKHSSCSLVLELNQWSKVLILLT